MFDFLLGPSKRDVWTSVAEEIGGGYAEGGFWKRDYLIKKHQAWQLVMDSYTVSSNSGSRHSSTRYTRLRLPFKNPAGFRFQVYTASIFAPLGELFGMQNIDIGDSKFDDQMVVKGYRTSDIQEQLNHDSIYDKFLKFHYIRLTVDEERGFFTSRFPEGVTQLKLTLRGILRDPERIKTLFLLATFLIERMVQLDLASPESPEIDLTQF
ncbi:MAG: hypothetical protein KDA65_13730 [Planctomycetaceae bacterium]|nr:hypothetical protein [Planctomycetaceae bacterium]